MVEILCPHCEEEIELDDDASENLHAPIATVSSRERQPKTKTIQAEGSPQAPQGAERGPSLGERLKLHAAVHIAMFAFLVLCLTGPTMYVVETEDGAAVADYSTTTFKTHSDDGYESFDTEYSEVMESLKALKEACVFAGGGGCELIDEAMSGFGRWNLASNIYTFMVGISAVLVGLSFAARGYGSRRWRTNGTSAEGFERLYGFGRFAIVPAGGLWLLATILFIFITPSFEATYSFAYDFAEGPEVKTVIRSYGCRCSCQWPQRRGRHVPVQHSA